MECSWILMIFIIFDKVVGEPCTSYQNVSETTLQSSWANSKCFPQSPVPTWYRFTSNAAGTLSVNCPSASACGGTGNVWINDSLPVYRDGITSVNMCISQGSNCCKQENALRTRNCNSFFVFELRRLPNCGIHYCYNKTDVTLVTVPTTSTTTTQSTTSTSTSTTTTTTSQSRASSTQSTTSTPTPTQPTTSATTSQPSSTTQSTTSTTIPTTSKLTPQPAASAIESQSTASKTTTSSTIIKSKTPTTHASTLLSTLLGTSSTTISKKSKNDQRKKEPNESNLTIAVAVGASIGALVLVVIIFFIVLRIYRPKLRYVIRTDQVQPLREEQNKNVKFNPQNLQCGNNKMFQDSS